MPCARRVVQELVEVREPHEVAETVGYDRGRDVAGSDKEECRIHSKDRRVSTLKITYNTFFVLLKDHL